MSQWFYTRNGEQFGPTNVGEIQKLLNAGTLKATDLAWQEGMSEWRKISEIRDFDAPPAIPQNNATNPYTTPHSFVAKEEKPTSEESLEEIIPGSVPLDVYACIGRAWDLTKSHFGKILLIGLVYLVTSWALNFPLGLIVRATDGPPRIIHQVGSSSVQGFPSKTTVIYQPFTVTRLICNIFSQLIGTFLALGATRIGLNLVSGKPFEISMLFGEGNKLIRAFCASILYGLMVVLGLLLLIVPGVLLALRYGQFMYAIVDRDLGVMDALRYSSRLTENNRSNLFLLAILQVLIVLAGALALLVGLIAAIPLIWLSGLVAYRFLQYGRPALTLEES